MLNIFYTSHYIGLFLMFCLKRDWKKFFDIIQKICIITKHGYARVELDTLDITDNYNLKSKELKLIVKLVKEHKTKIKRAWNEYFKQ